MTRNITASFRNAINSNFSGDVDLVFLTISHPTIADPIRVVMNTEDMRRGGDNFIGFPFDIELLSDDEQPPKAQLSIQNVDSGIGEAIRQLVTPPRLKIELMSSEDFYPYSGGMFDNYLPLAGLGGYAGLETGDLSEFSGSSSGTPVVDSALSYRGNKSLKFATGSIAYRELTLAVASPLVVARFAMYITGSGTSQQFAAFRTAADASVVRFRLDTANTLFVFNDITSVDTSTGFTVTQNSWHVFEVFMGVGAAIGQIKVVVDNVQVYSVTGQNTGTTNIGRAYFGKDTAAGVTIWFDEMSFYDLTIAGDVIYLADRLFLTNVSVDVMRITGTIEGWDYLQRVWPGVRARQDIFPGLFK